MSNPWPQMGQLLLEQGRVTHGQLESALEEQRRSGQPLGEILVGREVISRVDLAAALSTQWTWNKNHTEDETPAVEAHDSGAAEEQAPAPSGDQAQLIADLQARLRAADEEQAAAEARFEALETQVSDLTKAFGVLQRFLRAQAEELEAARAASAEHDQQITAVA